MPQESKLLQLTTEQIDIENEYVECLTELRKKLRIAAARLLLLEMCLDSEKRAAILAEMRGILRKAPPNTSLWEHALEGYVGEALMKKEFQQYVKKESDTLECLKKELMHTKDEGLKLLWQNIEEDEKKHARIIQTIIKNLYKID
jgi:rubrerythrin